MRFRNTSRYPEARVRELVEFGMRGVNTAGLAVNVKNAANCAYRGMAYQQAPRCSPTAKLSAVRYLVTIGIGKPERFPCDNMVTAWKFVGWTGIGGVPPAGYDPETWFVKTCLEGGKPVCQRYYTQQRHPYGGKSSPHIEYHTWEEGLVAIAAHEARHIHQFAHGKPKSEVDCERWAAKRLEEWRARS